jgi:SpoVK/Ycf46/Vps4 family AAA+-type ATPase
MPAEQHITTEHQWKDLVLNESAFQLLAQLFQNAKQKQSCNALFYGPAGTGKTLAATLLGKELGREVVRVDLGRLISQYVGETEKSLKEIFSRAETNNWILLFDEADALFSKRSKVKDSHDRYANQEVAYMIQRIHDHNGIVLLESNRKSNIDDEFLRRLQYVVHFPIPGPAERLVLWYRGLIKNNLSIERSDLREIANNFELSPAAITKVTKQLGEGSAESSPEMILTNIIANASNRK